MYTKVVYKCVGLQLDPDDLAFLVTELGILAAILRQRAKDDTREWAMSERYELKQEAQRCEDLARAISLAGMP